VLQKTEASLGKEKNIKIQERNPPPKEKNQA
jgi:hypothetical protein